MSTAVAKKQNGFNGIIRIGVLAGVAGGLAEVIWILLYARIAGGGAAVIADGVTATVFPGLAGTNVSVPLGLTIHFVLAGLLGVAVATAIRQYLPQLARTKVEAVLVVGALAVVWMINFLIILPVANPAFVHIVPMPVSFVSKSLFGIATVFVLRMHDARNVG